MAATPTLGNRLTGLLAAPGFRLLGTWTSAERVLSAWDVARPGCVQVNTRSIPSVASPREQGHEVAVIAAFRLPAAHRSPVTVTKVG